MKLYVIHDYKSIFPELKDSELTDRLIQMCLSGDADAPDALGNADAPGDGDAPDAAASAILVRREEGGKPFVEGGPHISVSHTGSLFALLVADCNVGLDVQHRRKLEAEKIAKRFFSPAEAAIVSEAVAAGNELPDEFFSIWTKKEAYAKYTGRGIEQVASGLDVLHLVDVRFREFMIDYEAEDCFCAVCAEKGADLNEIQISYRK
ncbi:MAG: 4'-phosphopantetheinyl transferase superfamily protein [Clostridia bacterium]|nr:4'-phosphopantetheinyl transferase superfamily protein [Clostridia bacterium]